MICGVPNPHDAIPCEREHGHEGMHGCREGALDYMLGAATTLYRAGTFWRMWPEDIRIRELPEAG